MPLPQRIALDELDVAETVFGFATFAAEQIGAHGSAADGVDAQLAQLLEQSRGVDAVLGTLDELLGGAATAHALLDPHSLDVDVEAFFASIPAGEQIVNDFGELAGPPPPPPPPPPPRPPQGGGDGGGGGGGGGGGDGGGCAISQRVLVFVNGFFIGEFCIR